MAGWESKYTELKNINGGNKYTTDSQLTIDMFIVPIENAEYAVQKSLNAESIANSAKTKVDSLAKVASSGSYDDLLNKPLLFDGNYNSLSNKPIFFAPTSAGTNGYVLKSNGSGEPTWMSQSDLTAGKDSEGNVIKDTYLKKSGGVMSGDLDMGSMDIINVANIEVGQDIVVESDSTNAKMNNQGFYAEDKEGNYFVKLDSHNLNLNNRCNVDEYGINSAYGGWGFNDANEPTLLNKAGRFIQIATDSLDGNYKQYYFPEEEGEVALTSDIPKKLGDLENDKNFLSFGVGVWGIGALTSSGKGLYIVKVENSTVFGGYAINLGLVCYDGNPIYSTFFYGTSHYRFEVNSGGGLSLKAYHGGSTSDLSGNTIFRYIKLAGK